MDPYGKVVESHAMLNMACSRMENELLPIVKYAMLKMDLLESASRW